MYCCGIDIGTKNLGISFVSDKEIISYRGDPHEMLRYEFDKNIIKITSNDKCEYKSLITLLNTIPEFDNTYKIGIEKQIAFHNAEILRIDGIIYGYLSAKYPNIVEYSSPKSRLNCCNKLLEEYPEGQKVKIPKKSIREQKIPSLKVIGYLYPDFYDFIFDKVDDEKLDDICDSAIYALMDTFLLPKIKNEFYSTGKSSIC